MACATEGNGPWGMSANSNYVLFEVLVNYLLSDTSVNDSQLLVYYY